jgi:hypothetical protein
VTQQVDWRVVDSLPDAGYLGGVDLAAAPAGLVRERFESGTGGRALLLPVGALVGGEVPGVVVVGCPEDVSHVLLLDPPGATAALGLLAFLGRRARTIRVALPSETSAAGLIAEAGRVRIRVGSWPPEEYGLFGVEDRASLDPRRAAGDWRVGEATDGLRRRSEWFQGREGGAG